jgi:excisionase family DNA binding protein
MSGQPQPSPTPALIGGGGSPILLTAEDVAARWQVPKSHVYRLTREQKLPTVKLGRYYRYRAAAIEAFELEGGIGTDA